MPVYLRRHIMMRGEYARLLLSGRKKATIRLGKVIPKYDEVIIHSWGRPIAKAKIVKVVYKRIRELTNEDAWKDGFKTRDELLRELRRVYGGFNDNNLVTVIELEVVQRFDKLVPEDPYLGLKPSDVGRLALRYLENELSHKELSILEELAKGRSIRRVAKRITGSPLNRNKIRRVVRKALALLVKKGIIGSSRNNKGKTL